MTMNRIKSLILCPVDSYYHQIDKKWEISRIDLMLDQVIGEGEFGRVMSGRLVEKSLASGNPWTS